MSENEQQKEFVKIANLESLIEAQLLASILDNENILYRIRSYHDTAYNGLFQFQKGWGEIYALLEDKEEIFKILDDIRMENQEFEMDEDDKDDEDDRDGRERY